ncbi:MAG: hypothetical protein OHK0039_38500 [Bacteroidia bacterium]
MQTPPAQDPAKLFDYILERERKERRRRQLRLALVIGAIAVPVAAGVLWYRLRPASPYRTYEVARLSYSQVVALLAEDPRPILVHDPATGRTDTIRRAEDFYLLLTAMSDSEAGLPLGEGEERQRGDSITFALPTAPAAQPAPTDDKTPRLRSELMPSFPGGEAALYQFLSGRLRYPAEAEEKRIEGKVLVRFVVQPDGSLTDIEILQGIGYGCDEEALRVIRLMPPWIPGEDNGEKVPVYSSLAVNFRFL